MSHFSVFVPTKATVRLTNGNTGHVKRIGIVLFHFPKCFVIYTVGQDYYFPGHHYNTTSLGALNFYVDFQKVASGIIEHCEFFDP